MKNKYHTPTMSDEKLFKAVKQNSIEEVRNALSEGSDVHFGEEKCLIRASKDGRLQIVKKLLDYGADVHRGSDGALCKAVCYGHLQVVKELLNHGANPCARDGGLLIQASEDGSLEMVKTLLDHGADIHAQRDGALFRAVCHGHLQVTRELLRRGANPFARDGRLLVVACEGSGNVEVIKEILAHGASASIDPSPLIEACSVGNVGAVRLLIQRGADPRALNNTPLHRACENGMIEVVEELLKHIKNPPIDEAIETVECVCDDDDDVNENLIKLLKEYKSNA